MYESFFGLTGLPFQLNPDPAYRFEGKAHRHALDALQQGLASGAQVMLVTGDAGAGKTTLLQGLLDGVDSTYRATVLVSAARLDAETLCDRLSDTLGVTRDPNVERWQQAVLARLGWGPSAVLLIIDEAQHLEPSALDLLEAMTSAAASAGTQLQICLLGQPELRILLGAPERASFRRQIRVDRHLGLLEEEETRAYIEHRLRRVGWTGRPRFEDHAFLEIFVFTSGIPRRINLLCNSLLLSACLGGEHTIDAPAVARAAAAMRDGSLQATPDLLEIESRLKPAAESAAETNDFEDTTLPDVRVAMTTEPAAASAPIETAVAHPAAAWQLHTRRRRQAVTAILAAAVIAIAVIAYVMTQGAARVG